MITWAFAWFLVSMIKEKDSEVDLGVAVLFIFTGLFDIAIVSIVFGVAPSC